MWTLSTGSTDELQADLGGKMRSSNLARRYLKGTLSPRRSTRALGRRDSARRIVSFQRKNSVAMAGKRFSRRASMSSCVHHLPSPSTFITFSLMVSLRGLPETGLDGPAGGDGT